MVGKMVFGERILTGDYELAMLALARDCGIR